MSKSTRRSAAGFTALELLFVLLIVGIFATIGMPMMQSYRLGAALGSAQEEVAAALQRARWRAINTGRAHTVQLDAGSNLVQIRQGGTSGTVVMSVRLSTYNATQSSAATSFQFDTRGLVASVQPTTAGPPVTITLTNPRSVTKQVTIDTLGRVVRS